MDNLKNEEALMMARGFVRVYADRYNFFFPDSTPGYAHFEDWAEKHEKECSPLEKRVFDLFLGWLKKKNNNPDRRLEAIQKPDMEDFFSENDQIILLAPLLSNR